MVGVNITTMESLISPPIARGSKPSPIPAQVIPDGPTDQGAGVNIFRPIPPNGKSCAYTGLAHSYMYRLLCNPGTARASVRVASLKQPGQTRAKQLYHVGDLLSYLSTLASKQTEKASKTEASA
jgi:hypothetical protein